MTSIVRASLHNGFLPLAANGSSCGAGYLITESRSRRPALKQPNLTMDRPQAKSATNRTSH